MIETRVVCDKLDLLGKILVLEIYDVLDDIGKSGGLAVLYKGGMDLKILDTVNHVITSKISNYPTNGNCKSVLFVYGNLISSRRKIILALW